jgi:hypothetical protein
MPSASQRPVWEILMPEKTILSDNLIAELEKHRGHISKTCATES